MSENAKIQKGRGTLNNIDGRFNEFQRTEIDDGWFHDEPANNLTEVSVESPRSIISRNQSPDLPFQQSINPYRGCEHGCIYCYARPSHAYLGLSPGIDFEIKLTIKPNAAELLRDELMAINYRCSTLSLGANTDPYQPIECHYNLTRELLQVMIEFSHPVNIVTKSSLIERDIDLLKQLAEKQLVNVHLSITTLDKTLARKLEPRASSPQRRLQTIETLKANGIPVSVLIAPVIPVLTDTELENIIDASAQAGAENIDYIFVRLPREVSPLFNDWLHTHYPDKAEHVMNRIKDSRNGKTNDPRFGYRLEGQGLYAEMIKKRFEVAVKKYPLNKSPAVLRTDLFHKPTKQMSLF
jgi:DNA repair photolyase